jgi:hypothetical protein
MRPGIYDGIALRNAAFVGAAWAAVMLIVATYFNPKAAAAGWLIGFAFWSQILIGALTLLMIHRLTGGRWGEAAAFVLEPTAAAVPLLFVLAVPLFVALRFLYPWWHGSGAIKPDVLSYYLNTPAFITRSMIALAGWSALSWFLPRTVGARAQLTAALGLAFHGIVISSVAVDWYLSFEAPFTSSSFGASVAVSSLVAALAWTALLAKIPTRDPALGDIGALLLTSLLGITYLDFMAVLVIWYGDLPREEIWFVERADFPWPLFAVAAFVLASLLPVLALLLSRIRNARSPLRAVGACVLVGLSCYDAYLIAPPAGPMSLATGLIAVVGIGLALGAITFGGIALTSRRERANAL